MSRIVLAMSGGVDSSVAAWLLKQAGHEVIGVFMRHGQEIEDRCATEGAVRAKQGCCSAADAADARRVAEMLDIPFYALNFEREFGRIIDYFVAEYTAGRTPNPCIVCNTWLKFGKLFEYADSVGAEFVATGHYARVGRYRPKTARPALCRGLDESKDQSYVLFGIERKLLAAAEISDRRISQRGNSPDGRASWASAWRDKPDSQEICFIPDQDHARFVREKRGTLDTSGDFVTTAGEVVGHHAGFEAFTDRPAERPESGFRRAALRRANRAGNSPRGAGHAGRADPPGAYRFAGQLARASRSRSSDEAASFSCQVKIRYRSRAYSAEVTPLPENRFHVRFSEPVQGVAPGQAAVCYRDDRVLGGGWID